MEESTNKKNEFEIAYELLGKSLKLTTESIQCLCGTIKNYVRGLQIQSGKDYVDVQGRGAEAFCFNREDTTKIWCVNICGLRVKDDELEFVGAISDRIHFDEESFLAADKEENDGDFSNWLSINDDDVYLSLTTLSVGTAILSIKP